jgi:hypothetical protein
MKTYGSIQVFVDSAAPLKAATVELDAQAHAHSAQGVIREL